MTSPGSGHAKIVVLDFGSQVSMLITRRLREVGVFSEMVPYHRAAEILDDPGLKGLVLSGGPASVTDPGAPRVGDEVFDCGLPLLGICYGMQLMCHQLGGRLAPAANREYGHAEIDVLDPDALFAGLPPRQAVWMSHGDRVDALPPGFTPLARTAWRCSRRSHAGCARSRTGGRRPRSSRRPWRRSASRSATSACCAPSPAASTRR